MGCSLARIEFQFWKAKNGSSDGKVTPNYLGALPPRSGGSDACGVTGLLGVRQPVKSFRSELL